MSRLWLMMRWSGDRNIAIVMRFPMLIGGSSVRFR
jgi:hypothetical protein